MSKQNHKKVSMTLLIINMFIVQLGVGLIIPVLPRFMQDFGLSGATLGYLVSAMGVTQFVFSPLAGEWADQYGRKIIIVAGIGMFSVSQFIFGAANDLWMLYLSRLIGGIGIAFTAPAITAYVADITNKEQRGKGLGWISAAMSLGIVIGPSIGGFLVKYGVRYPFYIAAAISACAMGAAMLLLPETLSREKQLVARSLPQKRQNILSQIALSCKLPYLSLLVLIFMLTFALVIVEVVFGLYVDVKYGFTPQEIAILLTAGALLGTLIQALLIEWLLQQFGERQVIHVSLLVAALALLLILVLDHFWHLLLATTLFLSITSILRPVITTLLSKMVEQDQGFVAGMNSAYTSLAIMIAPAVAGILFDVDTDLPYIFGVVLLFVSLFLSVWGEQQIIRAVKSCKHKNILPHQ